MIRFFTHIFIILFIALHVLSCRWEGADVERVMLADSLCTGIAVNRYKNPDTVYRFAMQLAELDGVDAEYRSIAYNALAYTAYINMDYSAAREYYNNVIADASCEVECLVADVGLMTLCYRTSANREFFDYRSTALHRIKRIGEEYDVLPQDEKMRFIRARVEFDIVSICYFANIGIEDELLISVEQLEKNIEFIEDAPLRLYARMVLNMQPSKSYKERAEALCYGLRRSREEGLLWLSGNYRLLLAIMLRNNYKSDDILSSEIARLNFSEVSKEELPLNMALEAVRDFSMYGDRYMAIEALTVAASCYTQSGHYDDALSLLGVALSWINDYYSIYYSDNDAISPLSLDNFQEWVEIERMENDSLINIAECLLSVRREASCAFAGLRNKPASDINRNSYLDLLRTTRLNKQFESRAEAAIENANRMYFLFVIAIITLITVAIAAYLLNSRWKRKNAEYTAYMRQIFRLCRQLMVALPCDLDSEKAVHNAVLDIIAKGLVGFSGEMAVEIVDREKHVVTAKNDYYFPLERMGKHGTEFLHMVFSHELSREKYLLLELMLPYIAAAIDEGLRIAHLGDESNMVEQLQQSYNIYLAEHKRENVLKRVSVSVVMGMQPYIDRMLNELRHLSRSVSRGDVERIRLEYVAELTEKLDDYNAVLEHWIKMRRGELNLHIENFALTELFEIIAKGIQAFELKGIRLEVKDTLSVVKADKALTLFMINTLADNAAKFTPAGGRVSVEAAEADDYVEISVTDTGEGLSQQDIDCILNKKVYNASQIGVGKRMSKNKGGGFGLMNCKGIIEKYRKTDDIFKVCRMNITSRPGEGSCFSFRLPKGVLRSLLMLLFVFVPFPMQAGNEVLQHVNALADSVYTCNLQARYSDAFDYANNAITKLNDFYRMKIGGNDTLSLIDGTSAEIRWWRSEIFPDTLREDVFYNLLDIRNELAVAALALQNWSAYRYNNGIYALLYRLVHEDKEAVVYYENMQRVANNSRAAVVLCVSLILLLVVVYAMLYLRHGVVERMNSLMVSDINRKLLKLSGGERVDAEEFARRMVNEILAGMRELLRMKRVSVLLSGENDVSVMATAPEYVEFVDDIYLRRVLESGDAITLQNGRIYVVPLTVISSGEQCVIGAMSFFAERKLTENEMMAVGLVVRYAASSAFHFTVRLGEKYRDLDELQEQMEHVKMEENRLHVQNLVMDNCLSVLKHETVYYPGRIRELVNKLRIDDAVDAVWCEKNAVIKELVDYYSSVFDVLSSCAMKQLDDTGFKVSALPMWQVWEYAERFVKKHSAKRGISLHLECIPSDAVVCGDSDLIFFLFESLLSAMMVVKEDGCLQLRATVEGSAVIVYLVDKRRSLSADELAEMFTPSRDKISTTGIDGMGNIVAKEIVRMHEEYMGRRGGRMEARNSESGLEIFFTLPK